jgi:hypothetical protein
VWRTADLMTFEGKLIRSVELFFDARPFEKFLNRSKSATWQRHLKKLARPSEHMDC